MIFPDDDDASEDDGEDDDNVSIYTIRNQIFFFTFFCLGCQTSVGQWC